MEKRMAALKVVRWELMWAELMVDKTDKRLVDLMVDKMDL